MALNEFMVWYAQAPRPGFSKATVSKLAGEAVDNGLLAPELAAGISRVKSVKSVEIRTGYHCGRHRPS
jgi:hypothetical protein